jgi:hypothetical protein
MRVRSRSYPTLLDIRFQGGAPFSTASEHKQALSLVRRLIGGSGVGFAGLVPGAAMLESLTGGRSAAHVFKLTPLFGPDSQVKGPPVIVKIAPRAQGTSEKLNYEKFVRWGLPTACRPELHGFARTRDLAGLCYAFVGGNGGARIDTLTDYLQRGDTSKLDLVLRRIFDSLRATWYSSHLLRHERDIAQRYLDRYFTGERETFATETALRACAERYFDARQSDGRCVIGSMSFPALRALLFASKRKRPYHSCILHRDLNTDNIVVGHDPDCVALIDFQKTGRGHVYEDLVALEASVRINFPPDASCSEILETERRIALARRQPRNDPYAASIRTIRHAAFSYFGRIEDAANYQFAVAAVGLRLMQAVDLSDVARARITASALWAAKALALELSA